MADQGLAVGTETGGVAPGSEDAVIAALRAELGTAAVLTGDAVSGRSAGIWRTDTITAKALVRPLNTDGVSAALRICHEHKQRVVPHGGLTGLVESGLASASDVVLSLEKMQQIEEIDEVDRTMLVQAGAILQNVQEAADAHDLSFPLDLGSRGSCSIGGNIATNAGGNRVIRFGMMRDMVLGLEAVLADGTVVSSLNRMIKNNAGYDLKQLFIGTEGTLGVVTRAVLRLREKPRDQATMFVAVSDFDRLSKVLKHMDASLGGNLSAFEVLWNNFYQLVTTEPASQQPPLGSEYPYYVLIEAMGCDNAIAEAALADAFEAELITDAVIAQNETQRMNLWAMRDDVEQCFRFAPVYTFDVSMRVSRMADYVDEVNARLAASFPQADVRNFTFGHMGDGNLHFVISLGTDAAPARAEVERCVYEPLAAVAGSVSAEHGVGLEKKPYLDVSRGPAEIALMRQLKQALDPHRLLNPGKIFDS